MKKHYLFPLFLSLLIPSSYAETRTKAALMFDNYPEAHTDPSKLLTILTKNIDAVILFYSNACGACRKAAALFDEIAVLFPSITFIKIKNALFQNLADEYGVNRVPTVFFLTKGKIVKQITGKSSVNKNNLVDLLNEIY